MSNLTLDQIQAILAAGAGGYTSPDGSIYNQTRQGGASMGGDAGETGPAGPQYFTRSHDGVYDVYNDQGRYDSTNKQGNASNDMGRFLLTAAAIAGGAQLAGAGAGAGAAGEAAASYGPAGFDWGSLGSLGDLSGASLGGADAAAGAGGAGGFSDTAALDALMGNTDLVGSLGNGSFAGGAGSLGAAGAAGGGLLGNLSASDIARLGGAALGAISGGQSHPGATTTTTRTLDPRLDAAAFGTGGLLTSATDWWNKNKATGMNQQMTDANQWQRGLLSDPGLKTGIYTQGGTGIGMMQQQRATNPFLNPAFNGRWGS